MQRPTLRTIAILAGVLVAYLAAGELGLELAFLHTSASPVWPPTGIAIAAFLLFGARVWPAIFVGAFFVNATTTGSLGSSLGIAVGNTLEGLVAAALVVRFASGLRAFDHPRDVARFVLLAGLASTAISATIGVTSLALAGLAPWSSFWSIWLTWWLGDVSGALIVAPPIVLWARGPKPNLSRGRLFDSALLALALLVVSQIVFGALWPSGSSNLPLQFLCIPPLLWAAFRFGPRGTATAAVALSAIAIQAALKGSGPFVRDSPNESLLLLQAFLAVTSATFLAVAASVRVRREAERGVKQFADQLEQIVARRTTELLATNQKLSEEIAERRRAEEMLVESEARLNDAQHVARIGSWEWNIGTDQVWWSDELYRIHGIDPRGGTISYREFLACVHPDDQQRVASILGQALEDHRPFAFEHAIVRPDGSVLTLLAQGEVLLDAGGAPRALLGTGQDITERKRADAQREHLAREQIRRREAEEANRAKDEFLAVLSHELRTPLSAILGWAQLIREGKCDPPTQRRALDTIVRNAHVQTRLISDVLDVSRIVSGKIKLDLDAVNLCGLIDAVTEGLSLAARERGVEIDVGYESRDALVRGDPSRLQQIVWNLVDNAIKYAAKNGRVVVRVQPVGEFHVITVQDDGSGIRPDFLPHVFERFRQADSTTTRQQGGLGLGLAIARHLVEIHGGSIQAQNRTDGHGAIFTVSLPRMVGSGPRAAPAGVAQDQDRVWLAGRHVLVVDDEEDARELVQHVLERWGARVTAASSVLEALRAIEQELPDLVLTDIGMPSRDGFALLRSVRELAPERGGRLPIAALTAYASAEDRHRILTAGFPVHLTKPLQLDELKQSLQELLRVREAGS